MLTATEARTEIKTLFDQACGIEKKYGDGIITNNEDKSRVDELLAEINGLEIKLGDLEAAEQRHLRLTKGQRQYSEPVRTEHPEYGHDVQDYQTKTFGEAFVTDDTYVNLHKSGFFNSPTNVPQFAVNLTEGVSVMDRLRNGQKALVYSASGVAGSLVTPEYRPGVLDILQQPLSLLDLIPTTGTVSDVISYVKETSRTNNAAMVAEASATTGTSGLKPESAFALSRAQESVKAVATWIPVTNRMLADAPAIRGMIDQRLLLMLRQKLEAEVLAGSGEGEELLGILNSGINSFARGANSIQDAIYKAAVVVQVTGLADPQVIVVHPTDWSTVRLARENAATGTLGQYLMGPPSMVGAQQLWGFRVVLSTAVSAGTALVGNFSLGGMYFEREGAVVRTGLIDDQFIRNMQTILVEARGAWITFRPDAFCQVTGLAA